MYESPIDCWQQLLMNAAFYLRLSKNTNYYWLSGFGIVAGATTDSSRCENMKKKEAKYERRRREKGRWSHATKNAVYANLSPAQLQRRYMPSIGFNDSRVKCSKWERDFFCFSPFHRSLASVHGVERPPFADLEDKINERGNLSFLDWRTGNFIRLNLLKWRHFCNEINSHKNKYSRSMRSIQS